ncbi:uroporphyrinogen III synthase [Noviherbaspirillum cavernae]|uniref:Uroporphyrinogen-III synthase n=1 Tax=Noviherbaspirillum cavernae TaxID=2320862 RepID=A0A418WZN4_9BURK|nr:uroporphyrinogen-III synthase [Noviherbaspirillum cavernae]RJG05651.1 uroporphyrinogen III synthase [Noviherbaspirillum cavernae]
MSRKVVITRPTAQALPLAQQVTGAGRDAIVFPLLEIHPLPDLAPLRMALQDLSGYAMVVFVSPNAIDAAFGVLPAWPDNLPIAVVGEGSRKALAQHGVTSSNATIFSPVNKLRTDSQTLLEVLDLDALRGKRVLIVRGETGRELLTDALRSSGIEVIQLSAYRRAAPELDQARRVQLTQLLESQNDWIVTSSEALRVLMQMLNQLDNNDAVAKMQHQRIIVPHVRIAETAQMLGLTNITLTGSGDEQLFAALQSRA